MKYVLVRIERGRRQQEHQMVWPKRYDAQEVQRQRRGPLVYEGAITAHHEDVEECLMRLPDGLADEYALDPQMSILSRAEAVTWLSENRRLAALPEEVVTDLPRIHAIQAKVAASLTLSTEDLNALDPSTSVPGVQHTPKTLKKLFGPMA